MNVTCGEVDLLVIYNCTNSAVTPEIMREAHYSTSWWFDNKILDSIRATSFTHPNDDDGINSAGYLKPMQAEVEVI